MAQPVIQTSFNSGEWSPSLNARVDIAKYRSGAATLRNFFVDYRGGATTSPGTKFIVATKFTSTTRLIPFSPSSTVSYILEFGQGYVRFITNGVQVPATEIASPYQATELAQLKFTQNVTKLIICHPNYPPYELIYLSPTSWTLTPITFGSTVSAPGGLGISTSIAAGTWNYAYVITAVDVNGQESAPSAYAAVANLADIRTVAGTITIMWAAVSGAQSYNVYKAIQNNGAAVPAGASFGFIGNITNTVLIDSNIVQDFAIGPPIPQNPFSGTGVQSVTITNPGSYSNGDAIPGVSFVGGGGSGAAALVSAGVTNIVINNAGIGYLVGDLLTFSNGVILRVASIDPSFDSVTGFTIITTGTINGGGITPLSNLSPVSSTGGFNFTVDITWGITSVGITSPGSGYGPAPTVTFSSGAAAATCTLGAASSGNPTVPSFFQQRLVLAGPVLNPQQFNMSQPGSYYNFDVTNPILPDNAFSGVLISGTLNTIQSLVSQPSGLVVLSDRQAWLINGGSPGSGIDATQAVANPQNFAGAASLPPIVAVDDILYVQAKNSIVRDTAFDWRKQNYTGQDISIMSSHLFYSYQLTEWAWAEEPFKIVWAIRNDGIILTLTFLKEQELIAWAHRDTQGSFMSVATITENSPVGFVDAVYVIVTRFINGAQVQYIERIVEQYYPNGATDSWQVDAGLRYDGASTLSFSGVTHLANAAVVGVATDNLGNVTTFSTTVSGGGTFTLSAPAAPATGYTRVTVGLSYTPQLKTLGLDTGDPTIQGKSKKIPAVTVRVKDTLGLSIGTTFDNLVEMEDLVVGNVGKDSNQLVTSLVTGDALQALDPDWQVPGQYCIQQSLPFPATILGLMPQLVIGDTPK